VTTDAQWQAALSNGDGDAPGEPHGPLGARKAAGSLRAPLAGNRDYRQSSGRHGGACLLFAVPLGDEWVSLSNRDKMASCLEAADA